MLHSKSLVVLSGGQDSVTCLGQALLESDCVQAIMFNYGQKHSIELHCAIQICNDLNIEYIVVQIPALQQFNDSGLICGNDQDVKESHSHKKGLPASFVPARNATFLTLAHGYAQKIGAVALYTGVCQTDYSGYPDCRENFIKSLEKTLNIGYETKIVINTPLMHLTKAETFEMAERNGMLEFVLQKSHTCYNGDHSTSHDWGFGCGECGACNLRAKGYAEYLANKG